MFTKVLQGWADECVINSWFFDESLMIPWSTHTTWTTSWLIALCLGCSPSVCTQFLSWLFQDVYQILQILGAGFGVFHQPDALVWELCSIWQYQFLRSTSGRIDHVSGLSDPHLLRNACVVYLSSKALQHKVGLVLSASGSWTLDQRLVPLVFVRLLWSHLWSTA